MRTKVSLVAMAVLALVSIGSAQGGGGGRGGQRGGMGAQRLTQLLRNPQVQTELKLTDDQKAKIEAMPRPQRGGGGGGGTPPTAEEMAKRETEDKAAVAAMLTPEQVTRLEQIRIQWAGPAAVTMPEVQAALALTEDQKAKIKDLQTKMGEANRALGEKMRNQEIDREAWMTTMQTNQATYKTEVEKVLTADQIAKWKSLGGAELKMEVRRPGGN